MARKVDRNAALTLTVACVHCGRPVVLLAHEDTIGIPDRDEFLRLHGNCLAAPPDASVDTRAGARPGI